MNGDVEVVTAVQPIPSRTPEAVVVVMLVAVPGINAPNIDDAEQATINNDASRVLMVVRVRWVSNQQRRIQTVCREKSPGKRMLRVEKSELTL